MNAAVGVRCARGKVTSHRDRAPHGAWTPSRLRRPSRSAPRSSRRPYRAGPDPLGQEKLGERARSEPGPQPWSDSSRGVDATPAHPQPVRRPLDPSFKAVAPVRIRSGVPPATSGGRSTIRQSRTVDPAPPYAHSSVADVVGSDERASATPRVSSRGLHRASGLVELRHHVRGDPVRCLERERDDAARVDLTQHEPWLAVSL